MKRSVGVAIPAFEASATIDAALASVAGQARRPDRVVVVDDGSSDETAERAEAWRDRLPLDVVRQGANRGVAAARTTAIEALDTDLIVALDADDVWLPHHLALLLRADERGADIVSPAAVRWRPGAHPEVEWAARAQSLPRRNDLDHLVAMNFVFAGSLFERRAFFDVGSTYRFDGCEDWDLWLRLVRSGRRVELLLVPSVLYRLHPGSLSADDGTLDREVEVLEAFRAETHDERLRRVAERSLRHRRARQALRRSYGSALDGELLRARVDALGALGGPGPVVARALGMALAPRRIVSAREAARR